MSVAKLKGPTADAGAAAAVAVQTPLPLTSVAATVPVPAATGSVPDEGDTCTDAFGRTGMLDLRNDLRFQKVTLNSKDWVFTTDVMLNF